MRNRLLSPCFVAIFAITLMSLSSVAWSQGQSLQLNFSSVVPGTIMDGSGNGTGLTTRLVGTGSGLPSDDPNLSLDTANGLLTVLSTNSDLNSQFQLDIGEYLGTNLAELGFTGRENFRVQAKFVNIQYAEDFDQFGLYVSDDPNFALRCGWLYLDQPLLATITTRRGHDDRGVDSVSLAPLPGDTIVLTLSRTAGFYDFSVHNLTHPTHSGTLTPNQPNYLNHTANLYVGIFAANSRNNNVKPMIVDQYSVKVQ